MNDVAFEGSDRSKGDGDVKETCEAEEFLMRVGERRRER
jgi:hypothetical protein